MFEYTKCDGTPIPGKGEKRALKLRLCDVYRRQDQTPSQIMGELGKLSDQDLNDFRGWFEEAGYPCL